MPQFPTFSHPPVHQDPARSLPAPAVSGQGGCTIDAGVQLVIAFNQVAGLLPRCTVGPAPSLVDLCPPLLLLPAIPQNIYNRWKTVCQSRPNHGFGLLHVQYACFVQPGYLA